MDRIKIKKKVLEILFWFLVILFFILIIWFITGDSPLIDQIALTFVGIVLTKLYSNDIKLFSKISKIETEVQHLKR